MRAEESRGRVGKGNEGEETRGRVGKRKEERRGKEGRGGGVGEDPLNLLSPPPGKKFPSYGTGLQVQSICEKFCRYKQLGVLIKFQLNGFVYIYALAPYTAADIYTGGHNLHHHSAFEVRLLDVQREHKGIPEDN